MSDDMGALYEDLQRECIELRAELFAAQDARHRLGHERDALRADLWTLHELALALRNCFDPYGRGRLTENMVGCADACERFDSFGEEPRT